MPSYQQQAAPIQQYIKANDNDRSQPRQNGSLSGLSPWGPQPKQYPQSNPPGNMPFNAMQGDQYSQNPMFMQWLMKLIGGNNAAGGYGGGR